PQSVRDLRRRAFALDLGRPDHDVHVAVPPAQDFQDVANRGAVERRDDADLARQRRQRALLRRIEQALRLQPLLQLLERELERAESLRLEMLADDLILALRLVDGDLPARHDPKAVDRLELEVAQGRAEHQPFEQRRGVFQREVEMSGVPDPDAGEFALDPDLEESLLEKIAD